ncbi:HU family DNA-binding protein [Parabacteroides sp. APC149_11_2_Y6]
MNNRLTIQDLAGLLADHTGKDKNVTERFLREFIAIVSEGVFADKIVKIKGLGTFKIIAVEKRESIHVNTGERFLIPAHYKFSFLPDKELKELVNKPFSFFETTEIGEDVDFSDMDVSEDTEEKETEDESVEEVMPEEQLLSLPVTESSDETEEGLPVVEEEAIVENETSLEEEAITETVEETIPENKEEAADCTVAAAADALIAEEPVVEESAMEEPIVQESTIEEILEDAAVKEEIAPEEVIPETTVSEETAVQPEEPVSSKKIILNSRTLIISAIVLLLVGINIGLYLNREFFKKEEVELPVAEDENIAVATPSDSLDLAKQAVENDKDTIQKHSATDTVAPASGIPAKEEKAPVETSAKKEIGLVKIASGDRLTLISLKYYGHKIFWVYLYEYNKDAIKDPNNVPIGTVIRVPAPELYGINAQSRSSIEKAAALQTQILAGAL